MNAINRGLTAMLLGAVAVTAACSDDDNGGGGGGGATTTTWVGTMQADNAIDFGGMDVVASTTSPIRSGNILNAMAPVTATVHINIVAPGPPVVLALVGTYDPATDALVVNDQGYTFTGTYDGAARLEGTWTGPADAGVFVALQDANGTGVAYCGTYSNATDDGTLGFTNVGGVLAGNAFTAGSATPLSVDGTIAGTAVAFTSGTATGTGTVTGTTAAGTIDAGGGVTFAWTAAECTP